MEKEKEKTKEKTIYDLKLHETLKVANTIEGNMEITRVAGGWVYALDFPGWRQTQVIFVPFHNEFMEINKPNKK